MKLAIAAELPGQVEGLARQQAAGDSILEGLRKDIKVWQSAVLEARLWLTACTACTCLAAWKFASSRQNLRHDKHARVAAFFQQVLRLLLQTRTVCNLHTAPACACSLALAAGSPTARAA